MNKPNSINAQRLNRRLEELSQIGRRPDGGVCRLAFSDADLLGRNYVASALSELGLEVRIDAVGNLFGILKGTSDQKAVMCGSHTDTVATGGRYDGALGVLAALECIERMVEEGFSPAQSVVIASFVNEEGVRFMPDMMGSLYHSGSLTLEDVLGATDKDGVSIGAELNRLSYSGQDALNDLDITAFVELHIEQGPVLEDAHIPIGIVSGVQGLSWQEVTVSGKSNHAGTTPMDRRLDAGVVANQLIHGIHALPLAMDGLRLTVGSVAYHPSLINVIPNKVTFTIDLRHPNPTQLEQAERLVQAILQAPQPCRVTSKPLARVDPCSFAPNVVEAAQKAAKSAGYSFTTMISGACHDAQILQSYYPSGMIFIPSKDGVSHDVSEYSSTHDIAAGANVLLGALLELSEGSLR